MRGRSTGVGAGGTPQHRFLAVCQCTVALRSSTGRCLRPPPLCRSRRRSLRSQRRPAHRPFTSRRRRGRRTRLPLHILFSFGGMPPLGSHPAWLPGKIAACRHARRGLRDKRARGMAGANSRAMAEKGVEATERPPQSLTPRGWELVRRLGASATAAKKDAILSHGPAFA